MGHYESQGCSWVEGETPECSYCEEKVEFETPTSGVYICGTSYCACEYVMNECYPIEFVED